MAPAIRTWFTSLTSASGSRAAAVNALRSSCVPPPGVEKNNWLRKLSRAMARDGEVADLAGLGALGVPADSARQGVLAESLDDRDLVGVAESGHAQQPDRVAVEALAPVLGDILLDLFLLVLGDDVGAEVLPGDVGEHAETGKNQKDSERRHELSTGGFSGSLRGQSRSHADDSRTPIRIADNFGKTSNAVGRVA